MCDNCKCACIDCAVKQKAINEQKRIIDDLDAAIGDQQSIIGEQATEIQRLRRMVAKGGKVAERLQDIFGGAE